MNRNILIFAVGFLALSMGVSARAEPSGNAGKKKAPAGREASSIVSKESVNTALESLTASTPEFKEGPALRAELNAIENDQEALIAFAQKALVKRNPLLLNHRIVFVERRQYPQDHHNTGTMFQKGEINEHSFGKVAGASLKVFSLSDGSVTTLLHAPEGMIRDPEVDFSGSKIIFSYRKNKDDDYHIYELAIDPSTGLVSDGSSLQQLTSLPGVSDIDPFYLSDGKVVFSSTREPKFCACNRHIMANLYRMEADGANIAQIGKSIEFEGHGVQMPDGRILYNRWEYSDRNFGGAQGLWTSNPDGTNHALYMWQSTPHPILNARPIPGSSHIIGVISSCHDRPWGALAIFDRSRGVEGKEPVVQIWPAGAMGRIADESQNYSGGGGFDNFTTLPVKYEDPFPLSENFFLLSRSIEPLPPRKNGKVGLYLVDTFGNEILVHESKEKEFGCFDPIPIRASSKPGRFADQTDYSKTTGTFLVMNAYEGTHMKGVEPGSVRHLRVIDNPPKMTWTAPGYGGQGRQSPAMNFHDFDNKRVMATVPVEQDGSVQFTVPTDKYLFFQLLDEKKKMIQSMRSGIVAMPGERNACVGCHDDRNSAPTRPTGSLAALKKAPFAVSEATAETKGNFSYQVEVQPIFDRHCVSCHDYEKEAGKTLNLSGDKTAMFAVSYIELHRKKLTGAIGGGPNKVYEAYEWGSHQSQLIQLLEEGHEKIELSDVEMQTLYKWVDLNAPYYPDYSSAYSTFPGGRCPLTQAELVELGKMTGKDFRRFSWNTPYLLNFDRPEYSPVLAGIHDEEIRTKVIAMIQTGVARLEETPRNDMPGYQPEKRDAARLKRYGELFQRELKNRQAILAGEKIYDPGIVQGGLAVEAGDGLTPRAPNFKNTLVAPASDALGCGVPEPQAKP